jgi:poly-gamma-glutamate capsule biosynthesis protein CapA/YwtB (metallophosphatase superfamily)
MKKYLFLLLALLYAITAFGNEPVRNDSLSIIFIGDVMGHGSQIKSALDPVTNTYNYDEVFQRVSPIIKKNDFAVANLEVTLAGKPFKGYPQFSSPDALAFACKNSGIDVLVTANNHSCDRGKKGIIRTINVLDSLQIMRTGTFKNAEDRARQNLLIMEEKGIKVGLLNYTYGTNGLPAPPPTIVNLIDQAAMLEDIHQSKKDSLDKLIVMLHWGNEYQLSPSNAQVSLAGFLFENGVDVIIGSHPHVLQPMEFHPGDDNKRERFIAYSLGNFVSNQRTAPRDGGTMVQLKFVKEGETVRMVDPGYYLTWVHKPFIQNRAMFSILPCSEYERNDFKGMDDFSESKMIKFMNGSRALFTKGNILVDEIISTP